MNFDLIIRNGTLIDGSGARRRRCDLGIAGERIAALGALEKASARREIEAEGLIVAPGFIDTHAHSDAYLILEPDAPSKVTQGITTEINGQCGGSAVPLSGEARLSSDWASHRYPDLRSDGTLAQRAAPGATWSDLQQYRRLFEAVRPALNTVQMVGHNTLRAAVMGYAPRPARPDELQTMTRLLEELLANGARGLSTGLLYQPGKYADSGEITALARTAAARGGIYATHLRSEGDQLLEAVEEQITLARNTGVQLQISHLKTAGPANWHKLEPLLEMLNCARAAGLPLFADRYPYTAAATDLDIVLPEWAARGGRDPILRHLRQSATRATIAAELDSSARDWHSVILGGGWSDLTRPLSGLSVAQAAAGLGLSAGTLVCAAILADETRTGAFFHGMSSENLRRIYQQSWLMVGSDASLRAPCGPLGADHPHPRAYGSMPRFLRLMTGGVEGFARVCSLETAIQRITSLPAMTFGLQGRGLLQQGYFADIAIFSEDFHDLADYQQPHRYARGLRHLIVNGALTYSAGRFSGQRRGRFLASS